MKTVLTIGFNKKSLRRFAGLLIEARTEAVIDIRLNNTSQLAGFSKRDDLEYILELLGIAYEHRPELAPTAELLAEYQAAKDFEAYKRGFRRLIRRRDMTAIGQDLLGRYSRFCLLCAEEKPDRCHRRLVAEAWKRRIKGVSIEHLI